ncbi:MAG: OB-fold nucleic acid binding domain-containing protein [Bacteroides sp.]|nr:OB-fold nucleic acid binding domain-containing protein [Bacteroides sp.]
MKYNIFKGLLACGAIATLASCSENSWNNEYLDDFKAPDVYTKVETVNYTLTESDFKAIGSLSSAIKQAEADGFTKSQLESWAKLGYFTADFPANKYLPIYFNSSSFPYFAANDGSTVTATYKEQTAGNEVINAIYSAKVYTLTTQNYISAWGSTSTFTDAFTPSTTAASKLPAILAATYPDAEAGEYVLVNFNQADTDPSFESVVITDINKVAVGTSCTLYGTVTGICAQGYILTDATGSLLVYYGSSFNADDYKIGMEIQISGKGSQYNGGLQLSPEAGKENIVASEPYTYPSPIAMDGAKMDELRDAVMTNYDLDTKKWVGGTMPVYVEFNATVTSTGNYVNFTVAGGSTTGSAYQPTAKVKELFVKGETIGVKGYLLSVNTNSSTGAPTYVNFVVTEANGTAIAEMAPSNPFTPAPAPIESYAANALYSFNGTAWAQATTISTLVSPAQLNAMGITQGYISNADAAANIPVLLKQLYPYAKADDTKLVAYQSGAKYANAAQFNYDGSTWTKFDNLETKTGQYARVNGGWIFNPDVTLVIPNVRQSEPGLSFYQVAVDWVKDNKGAEYIDRGNAEFYSGCSAYYCNINHDTSQARKYAQSAWENYTDNEIVPLMRERFLNEVMPATLKAYYPNANLIDGYTSPIIYEIDYVTYYGSTTFEGNTGNVNDTVKYEVTGPGEFKLVYSTWLGGEVNDAE